jgi:hypothetical protein
MEIDDLTSKQKDYAIFLPALSGFYASFIGKQRFNPMATDPARFPGGITDMEVFNWLNDQKALFPYRWSLYSAGHANLDLNKFDASEDMVRNRNPNTIILGDSGGFQIGKGRWDGDWNANSGCQVAQKKRHQVLTWLDNAANYSMVLDLPSWISSDPIVSKKINIRSYQDSVNGTKFNNEYFINNRRGVNNGGAKFLNVMQGNTHAEADDWYQQMKYYCDPAKYPDRHFNGWAFGGQTKVDVHLMLRRLAFIRFDGYMQQGKHDWLHVLGTSKLEWAILLTIVQRAIRRHVNPDFTISFDCASPFLATANGLFYYDVVLPHKGKWSYKMKDGIDDKKYSQDTRKWRDVVFTDFPDKYENFIDSPISKLCEMKDICIYSPGDLNKIGKEGRTSWDSFSYFLQMAHNVWTHIYAVQEANRQFDQGNYPSMLRRDHGNHEFFQDIVEDIFVSQSLSKALEIIDKYDHFWMELIGGAYAGGNTGKKVKNSTTMFLKLFEEVPVAKVESPDTLQDEFNDVKIEKDE